jgi:hypothetical protein
VAGFCRCRVGFVGWWNGPGRSYTQVVGTDAEGILEELSVRQHLTPHRPLKDVVAEVVDVTGVCPVAAQRAVAWLALSADQSIGRLRRSELMQLARSMHRFWSESESESAPADAGRPTR